jgi:hypothetical protein
VVARRPNLITFRGESDMHAMLPDAMLIVEGV